MHVCMYVRTYVYVCMCVDACKHVCVYDVRARACVRACAGVHECVCVRAHECVRVCVHKAVTCVEVKL